ncbi:MAG: hypothetical protein K6G42_04875 [Lachnospiraceae bacterium]|nr:hypothetical protein [Lachnospiraceae bacterium]
MRFYNIRRSQDFFTTLSNCTGKVDIVKENGNVVEYSGNKNEDSDLICFDGSIRFIELKFQKTEDLDRMLSFIMNEKRSA